MGGNSPVALLSSSYAFGARNFDTAKALEYMVKAGTQPGMGPHHDSERPFLAEYLKAGYAPADKDRIAASPGHWNTLATILRSRSLPKYSAA